MDNNKCAVCGNYGNKRILTVQELMFGLREHFQYSLCNDCNHLSLQNIPTDLSKYYSTGYYSFQKENEKWEGNPDNYEKSVFKRMTKKQILKFFLKGKISVDSYFMKFVKMFPEYKALSKIPLNRKSQLLDLGCGNGWLIRTLHEFGFKKVLGIDPYIEKDIYINNNLLIKKSFSLYSYENIKFNAIVFNHSFEHLLDPLGTLKDAYKILKDNGTIVIRIPILDSYAFEKYNEKWVQLDAPRHINLFSKNSLRILCEKANFIVQNIYCDSSAFQFWGSELYEKGISLNEIEFSPSKFFSSDILEEFKEKSRKLNEELKGDQAVFYIKKK